MHNWQRLAAAFFVVAAIAAAAYGALRTAGPAEVFLLCLAPLAAAWMGALVGGWLDWKLHGRSPFSPVFGPRFGWFYARRFWLRFAALFAAAWALFIAFALAVAVAAKAMEEVRPFLSARGALVLLLFLVVFSVEGALIGGIVDVIRYVHRKK